jgi:hypothetical protein
MKASADFPLVMPAQAGIHAGWPRTGSGMDSRLRGNDGSQSQDQPHLRSSVFICGFFALRTRPAVVSSLFHFPGVIHGG